MSIELRPHEIEAMLNKHSRDPVLVYQRVVTSRLKISDESPVSEEDILRDAKKIMARALTRGAAKLQNAENPKGGRP